MNLSLPIPPPAYWSSVPWWGYLAFALLSIVATPYFWQLARGRGSALRSREEQARATQADLDSQRTAFTASIQNEVTLVRQQAERERAIDERRIQQLDQECAVERERVWAMKEIAHDFRHGNVNTVARFNALLSMFRDFVDGKIVHERAVYMLGQIRPAEEPVPVPNIRDLKKD